MSSTPETTHAADDHFSRVDLARIVAETFVEDVDFHAEIDSTNTRAAELATAASPDDRATILVLADHQIAGRGRGANSWWSAAGALTFSVLLRPQELELPTHCWPLVSLTAGLAVCEAIESLGNNLTAQIKWPNDVYLDGRKVCGILIEAATAEPRTLILGIGLNVNNSAASAPPELREKVAALCDTMSFQCRRTDLLINLLQELATRLSELSSDTTRLQAAFSRRSLLTGRTVEIELPTRRITGLCCGIDADGALLVETAAGPERCLSGVVSRFN